MIQRRRIGPAAALALLVLPMSAPGQTPTDVRAAEAVVREAFEAHAAMQWDAVALLVHPQALRRFHLAQLEHQRMREQLRSRPAEERHPPGMPPEVRAWFDEQQQRHQAQYPSGVAADFAGISSLEELEALSPEQAFARWLEAHDARSLLIRQQQALGRTLPPEIPIAELHPASHIVGSVVEDDSTVQVLYRTGLPGEAAPDDELAQLAIATVRRSPHGWRIWTTQRDPELFGMQNWGIAVDLPDERAERLREMAEQDFAWPEGDRPRMRASVQGYAGDAQAPAAVRLEVVQPDGSAVRIELPYESLMPLWEYLQPWMYLPGREGGVQR